MPVTATYRPDPVFLRLGAATSGAPFFDAVEAAEFPQAALRYRNDRWAARVGLGGLTDDEWIRHFARFVPLPDNIPEPLALRYHGHQFRTYNPEIGDGRGFLFAQLRDDRGRLLDLATKGSGRTPYSRTADGRLTLKGGVREILATEMLEALGVYTSKSFSVIETGETLVRGDEPSPTRSCVLVRLGHSHVRFGTFQRLAHEGDARALQTLVDYCVEMFYPDVDEPDAVERTGAFFSRVVSATARLAAEWMAAGFVHGVLNTDNMNVTGESFDYGPWRFLPVADMAFTAAYFDQSGLYAYGRQPDAALWNLSRLGGALMSISSEDRLNACLREFGVKFESAMAGAFFRRLGLVRSGGGDFTFVVDLLQWMTASGVPFERFFFDWFCGRASAHRAEASPFSRLYAAPEFSSLMAQLTSFEPLHPLRLGKAYFNGDPCTMLIDEVEAIWAAIAERDDWSALSAKLVAIATMREGLALAN